MLKLEEITLLVATEDYGGMDHGIGGLDYIVETLDKYLDGECKLLEYDARELMLVPKEPGKVTGISKRFQANEELLKTRDKKQS
jgi:hypothetical protein